MLRHSDIPESPGGGEHSHVPDIDAVTVQQAQSQINQRAANELATAAPSIYREQHVSLLSNNQVAAAALPRLR